MEYIVFAVIVIIVVALILFMPKKKKKGSGSAEANAGAKSAIKEPKKPGVAKNKQQVKKKPVAKKPARASEKKTVMELQSAAQSLTDDELLNNSASFGDYCAPEDENSAVMNSGSVAGELFMSSKPVESKPEPFMQSAPTESKPEPFMQSAPVENKPEPFMQSAPENKPEPFMQPASASSSFNAASEAFNKNVVSADGSAEIKMDSVPVNHSKRVRKKVHSETVKVEKEESVSPISFTDNTFENFETPSVDDIFSMPGVSSDSVEDYLFADLPEMQLDQNNIDGIMAVPDSVPQVSEDLEPINQKKQEITPEAPVKQEEEVRESDPLYDDLHKEDEGDTSMGNTESEEDDHEQDGSSEVTEDEEEYFVSGSVSFNNSGLKFPDRPNEGKSSNLLPKEPNYDLDSEEDGVNIVIESPDVKQPYEQNGMIVLHNSLVYKGDKLQPWDIRFEVQLREGEEVTVDTGVGIRVPKGYGIKLVPVSNLRSKFGLSMVTPLEISKRDAAYSLKFVVKSDSVISYLSKNQPLVYVKIYKI